MIKILGFIWNLISDMFLFLIEKMIRERDVIIKIIKWIILSFVLKLFDLFGFVEFVIVKVKIMI